MTDLTKGVIEINGFEINSKTSINDILEGLANMWKFKIVSDDGRDALFRFEDVEIHGRMFKVKLNLFRAKLSHIELICTSETHSSYEERYCADCKWLKSILGDPASCADDGNSYYFDGIHIYSFIQRDLSRNPADAHITCSYEG